MDLKEMLAQTALLGGIDSGLLGQLVANISVQKIPKGETVFEEGEKGLSFYIIKSGSIAINKNVAGGMKRNLSNLSTGEIFGELALFDEETRSADAEAIEESELLVFDNERFHIFLNNNIEFASLFKSRIIKILCKRLRDTDEMLKEGVIWGFSMES